MRKVDRLIWKELWGPFGFGIAIFGALVFAAVMLTRITEWIVQGIAPMTVAELSLLFTPAIMTKSAAMAALLATLLAFTRLSNDSEVVALRAAGASLFRVMRPVALFCLLIAGLTFAVNEWVVPAASLRANALQIEVKRAIDQDRLVRSINRTINIRDGGILMLNALDFSLERSTLTQADLIVFDKNKVRSWWLQAEELRYFGPRDWRIVGRARLINAAGTQVIDLESGAWPEQVEQPDITPRNLFAGFTTDLDVLSMPQIMEEIQRLRRDPNPDWKQINNLEFGFWNKIALPLGAVVFGLLGAPLGIRNQRTGMGAGFALAIGLTFGYMMLANFMAVYSRGGVLPPVVASFTPLMIGIVAAAFTIARKNG